MEEEEIRVVTRFYRLELVNNKWEVVGVTTCYDNLLPFPPGFNPEDQSEIATGEVTPADDENSLEALGARYAQLKNACLWLYIYRAEEQRSTVFQAVTIVEGISAQSWGEVHRIGSCSDVFVEELAAPEASPALRALFKMQDASALARIDRGLARHFTRVYYVGGESRADWLMFMTSALSRFYFHGEPWP
jgi:hypothetical protein